jgi:hypothetical protein
MQVIFVHQSVAHSPSSLITTPTPSQSKVILLHDAIDGSLSNLGQHFKNFLRQLSQYRQICHQTIGLLPLFLRELLLPPTG